MIALLLSRIITPGEERCCLDEFEFLLSSLYSSREPRTVTK